MSRLVIASAAAFESEELVRRLGLLSIPVTNIITGIGHTQSTIIASRLQNFIRGRDVIFCCTGGVIGPFEAVSIFRATSVKLAPFDVRAGHSELLDPFDATCALTGLPLDLPTCDVFASLGITVACEVRPIPGVKLETLELYGVARAWLSEANSFTAIVASTNATGPTARQQWRDNFQLAATLTADTMVPYLERLRHSWTT